MKKVQQFLVVIATVLFTIACKKSNENVPSNESSKLFKVHQFASPAGGIFANAYIVELDKSVVVIDATLLVSTSKALKLKIDSIGKPLSGIFITHGHPDHYNGLGNFATNETPIYATQSVLDVIKKYDAAKETQWVPVFGDEWPRNRIFPNKTVTDKGAVTIEGVSFTVTEVGAGESDADTYWVANYNGKQHAFIGDIVLEGVHAYLSDGHYKEWLANLQRLKPTMNQMTLIYPGHGVIGDSKMFEWQKGYIDTYVAAVKRIANGNATLTDTQKAALVAEMKQYLPNDKLEFLIGLGADVVAAIIAKG